jgi:hypothetical protein
MGKNPADNNGIFNTILSHLDGFRWMDCRLFAFKAAAM